MPSSELRRVLLTAAQTIIGEVITQSTPTLLLVKTQQASALPSGGTVMNPVDHLATAVKQEPPILVPSVTPWVSQSGVLAATRVTRGSASNRLRDHSPLVSPQHTIGVDK